MQSRVAAAQKEAARASLRAAVDTAVGAADAAAAQGRPFSIIRLEVPVDALVLREATTTIVNKHKVRSEGRQNERPATGLCRERAGLVALVC